MRKLTKQDEHTLNTWFSQVEKSTSAAMKDIKAGKPLAAIVSLNFGIVYLKAVMSFVRKEMRK